MHDGAEPLKGGRRTSALNFPLEITAAAMWLSKYTTPHWLVPSFPSLQHLILFVLLLDTFLALSFMILPFVFALEFFLVFSGFFFCKFIFCLPIITSEF
jgi:hypothetical protein